MSTRPRPLSEVLQNTLEHSPLHAGVQRQAVLQHWVEVVGKENARHSRAVALNEGTLLVQVESSVWAQELALYRTQILQGLNALLGEDIVRDLRFHTGHELS